MLQAVGVHVALGGTPTVDREVPGLEFAADELPGLLPTEASLRCCCRLRAVMGVIGLCCRIRYGAKKQRSSSQRMACCWALCGGSNRCDAIVRA